MASFFHGASNVNIYGGEFNDIKGNYNAFDQSRHYSNLNSFNTTTHTTINSGNDNSRVYHGRYPNHPFRSADRAPSGSLGAQGYPPNANGNPLFQPPSMLPAMQPQYPPHGSRTHNESSFNVRNETIHNVNIDNSAEYGTPPDRKSRKGRRRGTQREEEDEEEEEGGSRRSSNPVNKPYNRPGRHPGYGPGTIPFFSDANFAPGHVQNMGPAIQRQVDQLMKNIFEPNAPAPAEEEGSEDSSSSSSSEEEYPRMKASPSINTGMANMSLNEAFSRNKSDPQIPLPASPSENAAPPPRPENVHLRSAPILQKQPTFMPPNPAVPNWGPFPAYPLAANPQWNGQHQTAASSTSPSGQSSLSTAQQWPPAGTYAPHSNHWDKPHHNMYTAPMASPPPPPPPGPVFNTIHGDYNKVDQTVHSTNINSGNTHNVLIQDSYNDNSVRSFAPEPASRPKKQGP